MEKLIEKYNIALKALKSLEVALNKLQHKNDPADYDIIRDSVIQRFEYTIELFWKFLKFYLATVLKLDLEKGSPRVVLREALNAGVIHQEQFNSFIDALADRNLSSHTYNLELAQEMVERIPGYHDLIRSVLCSISI